MAKLFIIVTPVFCHMIFQK